MSYTEIYRLGRDPGKVGEIHNAWRGAMYVWNDMAKRYHGMDGFPFGGDSEQGKIWNTDAHHRLPLHEIIVLKSTMDNAAARAEDAGETPPQEEG